MKMVQRRGRVPVGTLDADMSVGLITAFTTDRALLNAAIANPVTFRGSDPLQIAGTRNLEQAPGSLTTDSGGSRTEEINEVIRRSNRQEDQFNRARVDRQLSLIT